MQTKQELEDWYVKKDPWSYETIQDDSIRKSIIINAIKEYCGYLDSILDIGAGEGFLTKDLPALVIYGYDISDTAMSRFPKNVIPIKEFGKYDAVISTGTLYQQYDHEKIANDIKNSAKKYVIISGIKDWLIPYDFGKIIYEEEFPYREYTQKLTIYEVN